MDYKGQKLSEIMYHVIVILFGVIAWLYGYLEKDFSKTVYGWMGGLALAIILCVPDWPYFNNNKVQWLEELPDHSEENESKSSTKSKSKKSRKD